MRPPALVPELYVADIAASLDFYVGMLGFSVLYDRPADSFAYLDHHGAHLMLEEIMPGESTWLTGAMERPFGRGVNFQITTPSLARLLERLPPECIFLPEEEAWYETADGFVGQRQILITDPDGYLLRFTEYVGRRAEPPSEGRTVKRLGNANG